MDPPLILGDQIYMANVHLRAFPSPTYNVTVRRVNASSGTQETLFSIAASSSELVSDGENLYVYTGSYIEVFNLTAHRFDGRLSTSLNPAVDQTTPLPGFDTDRCVSPLLQGHVLVIACRDRASFGQADAVFVRAFDTRTRSVLWTWVRDSETAVRPAGNNPVTWQGFSYAPRKSGFFVELSGLALVGNTLTLVDYVTDGDALEREDNRGGAVVSEVWFLNATRGAFEGLRWQLATTGTVSQTGPGAVGANAPNRPPHATGASHWAFAKFDSLIRYNLSDPPSSKATDSRPGPNLEGDVDTTIALWGDRLYVPNRRGILEFDFELTQGWAFELPAGFELVEGPTVATGTCVFVQSSRQRQDRESPGILHCIDPRTGRERWSHAFPRQVQFSVSDEMLAAVDARGRLTILGRSAASIGIQTRASTLYPRPGEPFWLAFSDTRPGAFGPATDFRIDWGDGTGADWAPGDVFTHQYEAPVTFTVRAWARNPAGQESTTSLQIYAGTIDPSLSFLSKALLPENQDKTFFVVGLLVTLILIRNARFQREIRAIDDAYERTEADPEACESVLEEYRQRARQHLFSHRLADSQAQVLERRVDELHRTVRLRIVDEHFEFLPHGMVKRLRAILDDGLVTQLERSHFLGALKALPTVSKSQKGQIQDLIDTWFERDAARQHQRTSRSSRPLP
ncbi:MAG: hypothetical protein HYT80_02080 [Euryarchaeota archaeon]|nr:hypothetical protein [Euryarchaeota archaeon]